MPVRSLRDGSIQVADNSGVGGANKVTVDIEEGDLAWTEHRPVNIILDRGVLNHPRKANDQPIDLAFSVKHAGFLAGNVASGAISLYEALTLTGGAAAWVSSSANTDAKSVDIVFTITDPAGGAAETVTFTEFCAEDISFKEGDPFDTLAVSGRCVLIAATYA